MRLSLLTQRTFDQDTVYLYDAFLRQLWNGVRYASLTSPSIWSADDVREYFNNNADLFDIWLMGEFVSLWKEYHSHQERVIFFSELQQFIQKKVLIWYLEIKKDQKS